MSKEKYDVEALLKEGATVQFPIQGWSMYPFLHHLDIVTVEPIDDCLLKVNDVVLYRRINGPLVLHRIHRIQNDNIWLCGDNQFELEGPIKIHQIIGILSAFQNQKEYVSVNSKSYRVKSSVWRFIRPFRPVFTQVIHRIKKIG